MNRLQQINFLTYSKAFGHHNIDIMAGHESYSYTLKYQYAHKYNFYTIGNPEFNNAITMSDMNSYTQEHSMESFFGRVNYDFDNKILSICKYSFR